MVSGLFGMVGLPGIEDGVKAVFRGKKAIPPELPKGSSKRAQKRRRAEVKKIERLNNDTQKWKESVYNGIIMGFIIDHAIADYLKDSNGDTKIAGADFILFKGGKDSIALEETYPWYCSFMADFYNDFFNNCFYLSKGKSCM